MTPEPERDVLAGMRQMQSFGRWYVRREDVRARITELTERMERAEEENKRIHRDMEANCVTLADNLELEAEIGQLRARLAAVEGREPVIADPKSTYWCLRTCECGLDATDHSVGKECRGFNPDWPLVQERIYEIADGPPPKPSEPRVTDEELVRRMQAAEITTRHLKAYSDDKFAYRAGKIDSRWAEGLTMVEAIILWWERELRDEILGPHLTSPSEPEEEERSAWLVVEPGSSLKRCPECGASALEGQPDCMTCGAHPEDDASWRIAGRTPRRALDPQPQEETEDG